MSTEPAPTLACHRCGYDLRAHDPDTVCPECGTSVAESVREAALPRRPAWRDSDPRWRRRLLAGLWVLVMMPAWHMAERHGLLSDLPAPDLFGYGSVESLGQTLFGGKLVGVYPALAVFVFVGLILLFARDRSPHASLTRKSLLARARRLGPVTASAMVVLHMAPVSLIGGLILAGIAEVLFSMPLRHEPEVTSAVVFVATHLLWYGPHNSGSDRPVAVAFACVTVLLVCLPLHDALARTLPARRRFAFVAALPLVPLVGFALFHLLELAVYATGILPHPVDRRGRPLEELPVYINGLFFVPGTVEWFLSDPATIFNFRVNFVRGEGEFLKWVSVLTIALWLTLAQLISYRKPCRVSGPRPGGT